MTEDRPRILFVCPSDASFIRVDREVLAERWPVEVWRQPGGFTNLFKLLPMLWRADVVVGWWASWHTFWPFTLAALFRKPSLLIVGGFDTANMPEIGYGYQQGGLRRGSVAGSCAGRPSSSRTPTTAGARSSATSAFRPSAWRSSTTACPIPTGS